MTTVQGPIIYWEKNEEGVNSKEWMTTQNLFTDLCISF